MTEEKGKRSTESLLLAIGLAFLVIVILIIVVFPRDTSNNGGDEEKGPWRDLTNFKATVSGYEYFDYKEVKGTGELDDVSNPEKTVYILIGIQREMNSSELVDMGKFLDRGGHIIIADDGTNANRITEYLYGRTGGNVEFTGNRYLVDKLFSESEGSDRGYEYNLSFIKGDTKSIFGTRYSLLVHSPNGLMSDGPGRPVIWTTKYLTVEDVNGNWQMDNDPPDRFLPYGNISVEYDAGDGSVTYISSTGLFTDNVFNRYQNGDFVISYIYSLIPQGGDVLVDLSKQNTSTSPHNVKIPY
ncbi:MAG: hypothetical protein ACMUIE_08965 [Thermoplasmatota archaeon]